MKKNKNKFITNKQILFNQKGQIKFVKRVLYINSNKYYSYLYK